MKRDGRRAHRINDLLQTALATILLREASFFLDCMVTVTSVDVSPDLSVAKVYVSVLEEEKAVSAVRALNSEAKSLRHLLAEAVRLRVTPELRFLFDDSVLRGNRIASLVRDVRSQTGG